MQKTQAQKGSFTIFFILFIIPVLFLLLAIAVEFSLIATFKEDLQSRVDRAVLAGSKKLPTTTLAEETARMSLGTDLAVTFEITPAKVAASATAEYQGIFSRYFSPLTFPITVYGSSKLKSIRSLVILDLSDNLPENDLIPPASYFKEIKYQNLNETQSKIETDLCFNPLLQQAKKLSDGIYSRYAVNPNIQVGLGFSPTTSQSALEISILPRQGIQDSLLPANYNDPVTPDQCLLAAQEESIHNDYRGYFGADSAKVINITNSNYLTNTINYKHSIWSRPLTIRVTPNVPQQINSALAILLNNADNTTELKGGKKLVINYITTNSLLVNSITQNLLNLSSDLDYLAINFITIYDALYLPPSTNTFEKNNNLVIRKIYVGHDSMVDTIAAQVSGLDLQAQLSE